jgi:hypothetical protein
MADGTAYAVSSFQGVWYLRGAEAIRVQEVPHFSQIPSASEEKPLDRKGAHLFALATHARHEVRHLRREREEKDEGEPAEGP